MATVKQYLLDALAERARRESALSDALVNPDPRAAAVAALEPVRDAVAELVKRVQRDGIVASDQFWDALAELDTLVGGTMAKPAVTRQRSSEPTSSALPMGRVVSSLSTAGAVPTGEVLTPASTHAFAPAAKR